MKVTWFRLICVCLAVKYVRERLYLRAKNTELIYTRGWRVYATCHAPLSLFVDTFIYSLKQFWKVQP